VPVDRSLGADAFQLVELIESCDMAGSSEPGRAWSPAFEARTFSVEEREHV
jgi:hypothetical protein